MPQVLDAQQRRCTGLLGQHSICLLASSTACVALKGGCLCKISRMCSCALWHLHSAYGLERRSRPCTIMSRLQDCLALSITYPHSKLHRVRPAALEGGCICIGNSNARRLCSCFLPAASMYSALKHSTSRQAALTASLLRPACQQGTVDTP